MAQLYIPIEMFPEGTTHTVQSHRIGAAVGERKAEAHYSQHVPEPVVIFVEIWTVERIRENENFMKFTYNFHLQTG